MYDTYYHPGEPPPTTQQPPVEATELGEGKAEKIAILQLTKPSKTKNKTGLLMLALLPILGALLVARMSISPASDPLPQQSQATPENQRQGEDTQTVEANAKTGATEGDGIDLDALIKGIEQSKGTAKQSITIARENLDYSMVSLMLTQMREANKAPHYTPPDRWWLLKAKEKAEQFKNRAANLGDFTTYKGIKNWQVWLTEVNALLVIHDLLIESGKGNQLQVLPNPNLAVSLSQYLQFTELAIAGDTQALEQMRSIAEGQKNADKYNQEVKTNYDKSLTNSH
ncbi:MAG TPA: hypothetical protein VK211_11920 [Kamptonema sp.]|nr:hypothetical protein [Kamptonema sp.]